MLSENYIKLNPLLKISSTNEATDILKRLMEEGNFFFRVEKTKYRSLQINQKQLFDPDGYYIWQWEHPWVRTKRMIYSGLMVYVFFTIGKYLDRFHFDNGSVSFVAKSTSFRIILSVHGNDVVLGFLVCYCYCQVFIQLIILIYF